MSRKHPTDQPPEPKSDAQAAVSPVQDPPADLGSDQPPEAPVVDQDAPPADPETPSAETDPRLVFPHPCFAWAMVDGVKSPVLNGEIVVDQAEREGITVLVTTGGRKIFLCTISEYEAVYGKLIPDVRVQIAARYPNAA